MTNTYDDLFNGKRVNWSELDEQGRYDAWSFYYRYTKAPFIYTAFCRYMDQKTSVEQHFAA